MIKDTFDVDKKEYLEALYKPDNSKKGNVDKEIAFLIDKINSSDKYYTTSSCAGRISIIKIPDSLRKDEADWLFVSHQPITYEELKIDKIDWPKEAVWFRYESAILHVACRTIEDAQEFVNVAKFSGFKRSGIMATKKRIIIEVTSTEHMDTIIARNNELIASESYLKILVEEADKKMARNRKKTEKLFKELIV